jgi:hypothetical protein
MKVLIGILVAVTLVIGAYFFLNQSEEEVLDAVTQEEAAVMEEDSTENKELKQTGTIDDIQAMNDVVCEYRNDYAESEETNVTEGVIYRSGEKTKIEGSAGYSVSTMNENEKFSIDVILIDDIAYSWSEAGAFKMDLAKIEDFNQKMSETYGNFYSTEDAGIDVLESELEYNCQPWEVDESVFELPNEIEFVDFYEMMEGNMRQMEGVMNQFKDMDIPMPQ